jgi:uncharacterized protein (DUF302 family)
MDLNQNQILPPFYIHCTVRLCMDRRQLLSSGAMTLALLTGNLARARPADMAGNNHQSIDTQSMPSRDRNASVTGLVTVDRDESFETVVTQITTTIETNEKLTLITTVDHAKNAASVGLDLCPTTLIMFGNPALGTPLMQRERTIGIDLPQKMLVWEDEGVHVAYNDPQYLAERHGIDNANDILTKISHALEQIATGK